AVQKGVYHGGIQCRGLRLGGPYGEHNHAPAPDQPDREAQRKCLPGIPDPPCARCLGARVLPGLQERPGKVYRGILEPRKLGRGEQAVYHAPEKITSPFKITFFPRHTVQGKKFSKEEKWRGWVCER